MSTFDDDYDDDAEPEQDQPPARRGPTEAEIRIWRKEAKKWKEAEPQLTKLQQENLVLRTPGLNALSERQMRALFATHDGEQTPDALRATAQDLGFVAAPEPEVPDAEMAAHQRLIDASAGAASVTPDPLDDAAKIAQMSEQEVLAWARANGRLEVQ